MEVYTIKLNFILCL
uniref:Uncharacterized protein n=1 Tax=Rhizophora mucronata TaxID=61149 RepID=A0A2P2QHS0_RHIMU